MIAVIRASRTRGTCSMPSADDSAGTASARPPRARAAYQRASASELLKAAMCAAMPLSDSLSTADVVIVGRLMRGIGTYQFNYCRRNVVDRMDELRSAVFDKFAWHAPDHRGGLRLRNSSPT